MLVHIVWTTILARRAHASKLTPSRRTDASPMVRSTDDAPSVATSARATVVLAAVLALPVLYLHARRAVVNDLSTLTAAPSSSRRAA